MVDVMQGLVSEAKKNKFSTIGISQLSDEDIVSVWDNVSGFVEKQMSQQKGVHIPGLGTFTFSQKKLDVGNNKFILIQRPVFQLSEKFAQIHGLNYTKHHTSGQIPIVQLNFSALSYESPFDRDVVEACVKEVLGAMSRSVGAKKNVEFSFMGIGRLQIRENKVKMKFYKDFLNSMDGSGKLVEALKDRPGTVDSVMSNRSPSRPFTSNTLVLPRITQGGLSLAPDTDAKKSDSMPTIQEEPKEDVPKPQEEPQVDDFDTFPDAGAILNEVGLNLDETPGDGGDAGVDRLTLDGQEDAEVEGQQQVGIEVDIQQEDLSDARASRQGSRMAIPMAKATGISFADDLLMPQLSNRGMKGGPSLTKSSPAPLTGRRPLSPLQLPNSAQNPRLTPLYAEVNGDLPRSQSAERIKLPTPPKPPSSACGHNAGQELCYLCHQRERRNIPVSFTEERKSREQEEDRLLQQYQHMKDTEAILAEQEHILDKREENQRMAAFNLGTADAIKTKKNTRPLDFHSSYIFQKRPLTPPRFIKQDTYFKDLSSQVVAKDEHSKKRRADEEFLERLEQVQLAEDLAHQREQYLKDKNEQQEQYKRALSAQIEVRDSLLGGDSASNTRIRSSKRIGPLTLPRPQLILPFSQSYPLKIAVTNYDTHNKKRTITTVRFKPLPLPSRVPDSTDPVFGKHDMTNEAMASRRRRAHELYREQLVTVEQRKRDAILKRLTDQKEEEEMLHRTKRELLDDRADRYDRMHQNRKKLEKDWSQADSLKKQREQEERLHTRNPGQLLHEQCDRYHRCNQCKRTTQNCGESNIWRESRYIPGSRLMV